MYFVGKNDRRRADDFRGELHDSDGLLMHTGAGEWIRRPLENPVAPSVSAFLDANPRGYGLLQRDRDFTSYQDLELAYELRPSYWIEPREGWGEGRVELLELPTNDETNDNDKVAASKRKGIWMGGAVPLGYRVEDRALHVVEDEAEFVGSLFRRYLEVGSVVRLKTALDAENLRSPLRTSGTGRQSGGNLMSRGLCRRGRNGRPAGISALPGFGSRAFAGLGPRSPGRRSPNEVRRGSALCGAAVRHRSGWTGSSRGGSFQSLALPRKDWLSVRKRACVRVRGRPRKLWRRVRTLRPNDRL